MKLTVLFTLFQLAFAAYQSVSLSFPASLGTNPPSLPPIPRGFSVTPRPGVSDPLPIAKAFHLLSTVVFQAWVSKGRSAQPVTRYFRDDKFGWTFDLRLSGEYSTMWRNLTTCGWVAGKILENAVINMGVDQQAWSKPRNGYDVSDPAGRMLGRAVLQRNLRQDEVRDPDLTNSSFPSAPWPGVSDIRSNGTITAEANLSSVQAPKLLELIFAESKDQMHRKAFLLLMLEFMDGTIYAWDPDTLLTTVTGGRKAKPSRLTRFTEAGSALD